MFSRQAKKSRKKDQQWKPWLLLSISLIITKVFTDWHAAPWSPFWCCWIIVYEESAAAEVQAFFFRPQLSRRLSSRTAVSLWLFAQSSKSGLGSTAPAAPDATYRKRRATEALASANAALASIATAKKELVSSSSSIKSADFYCSLLSSTPKLSVANELITAYLDTREPSNTMSPYQSMFTDPAWSLALQFIVQIIT